MNRSKFLLFFILFTILGVFLGILISISFQKNTQDFSSGSQISSGDIISNYTASGDVYLTSDSGNSFQEMPIIPKNTLTDTIKSIYLTGWSAGTKSKRQSVIQNLKDYGFNAVVIDIKDEAGQLSYKSTVQTAIDISASRNMISDIRAVIQEFHDADIYVIGRIVTFKDPTYAKKIPEIAYCKSDGSLWQDYAGNYWPNPYNKDSWEYPIALAKEAATLGFDEIQFDYIRFPSSEGKTKNIAFGFQSDSQTKSDIINAFLTKVMDELYEYDVIVSADVFGITTKKLGDFEHIGQDFQAISKIVDVICPMVYPSHYGFGEYGVRAPDTQPYKIVYSALNDALKIYSITSGDNQLAKIRPYLQDFSASWLKKENYILYDSKAVTAQLQACYDLKIYDFTLWDPNNKYAYESVLNIVEVPSGDSKTSLSVIQ